MSVVQTEAWSFSLAFTVRKPSRTASATIQSDEFHMSLMYMARCAVKIGYLADLSAATTSIWRPIQAYFKHLVVCNVVPYTLPLNTLGIQ